jgi:hypothetical protein
MVNVVVEPSSSFSLGGLSLSRKKGTATLKLHLPGPGKVAISGRGIKKVSRSAANGGKLSLPIVPTASTRAKLASAGRAKVKLAIKFTPTGGTPSTRSKRIELIKH